MLLLVKFIFEKYVFTGVELLTGSLLVAAKSEIKVEARTVGDSAQWFDWDVGDNRNIGQTSKPTLTFSYRDAGM